MRLTSERCHSELVIDLYCGLGGWAEGMLAEGLTVYGFDIERHQCGEHKYPAQLIIQDVLTLHGKQFKDAIGIVASPPCQEPSYRAMPWKRAKALNASGPPRKFIELFNACFRIQREACEAAGRHIPLIVENVRGAQPFVGRASWHFGSFYLWGDVPALMPMTRSIKNWGGSWFNVAHNTESGKGRNPDGRKIGNAAFQPGALVPKGSGRTSWFFGNTKHELRATSSGSVQRKMVSAMIAKIPFPLARHIAGYFRGLERGACD